MKNKNHKNRHNKFNEIGTPPQPVLTRWGTWLNAAEYYAKNLVKVREIVNAFEGDGIRVSNAKAAVNDSNVAKLLAEVHRDYQVLPKMIQKIESSKWTIKEAHADISALDLKEDCVGIGAYIKKRMLKNCDMENIVNLKQEDICPALYAELQCCQPTTAAIERSFSMLSKLQVLAKKLEYFGKIAITFLTLAQNPFNYSKRFNIILEVNEGKLVHNYGNFNYKYMYFLKKCIFLRIFI